MGLASVDHVEVCKAVQEDWRQGRKVGVLRDDRCLVGGLMKVRRRRMTQHQLLMVVVVIRNVVCL